MEDFLCLSEREKIILGHIKEGGKFRTMAEKFNLSNTRIQQIYKKAIRKEKMNLPRERNCWFIRELFKRHLIQPQVTTRILNCLKNYNVNYEDWKCDEDLIQFWTKFGYTRQWKELPNFGKKSYDFIAIGWNIPTISQIMENKKPYLSLEEAWKIASGEERRKFLGTFKLFKVEDKT